MRWAIREEGPPFRRGNGGQSVVPDVGVGADLEVGAEDRDSRGYFSGGGTRRRERDFYGVEEGIRKVEEEVCGDAGLQGVVIHGRYRSALRHHGWIRVQRADGQPRDVVQRQELDFVPRGCDLRLWLCENLAAGATPFGALGAEEGGQRTQFVYEADVGVHLGEFLGWGEGSGPAVSLDALDRLGVVRGVVEVETFEGGGSFAHRSGFRPLFLLGAGRGVEVHDAGVGRGRGEVDVVGGEGRGRGVGFDLGLVEGAEVGEAVVVGGGGLVPGWVLVGRAIASPGIELLSALALLVALLVGGQRFPSVRDPRQLGADALALFELDADLDAAPLAVLALQDEGGAPLAGGV